MEDPDQIYLRDLAIRGLTALSIIALVVSILLSLSKSRHIYLMDIETNRFEFISKAALDVYVYNTSIWATAADGKTNESHDCFTGYVTILPGAHVEFDVQDEFQTLTVTTRKDRPVANTVILEGQKGPDEEFFSASYTRRVSVQASANCFPEDQEEQQAYLSFGHDTPVRVFGEGHIGRKIRDIEGLGSGNVDPKPVFMSGEVKVLIRHSSPFTLSGRNLSELGSLRVPPDSAIEPLDYVNSFGRDTKPTVMRGHMVFKDGLYHVSTIADADALLVYMPSSALDRVHSDRLTFSLLQRLRADPFLSSALSVAIGAFGLMLGFAQVDRDVLWSFRRRRKPAQAAKDESDKRF